MGCSCKHNEENIQAGLEVIKELRKLFIQRMTVDSQTQDRRRADYNQAIFYDFGNGEYEQCFNGTTMEMVLEKFDSAMADWRRTFCDVPTCRRK